MRKETTPSWPEGNQRSGRLRLDVKRNDDKVERDRGKGGRKEDSSLRGEKRHRSNQGHLHKKGETGGQ